MVLWVSPSFGDAESDTIKMARKRFAEGVAAADAGNYEAARLAFQQAYMLKPHPSVLRNLGEAELKTAHYLDAARHLSEFVHTSTFGSADDREHAKKALARAETKIGRLLVDVDVKGADVTVDGEKLAVSALNSEPVYLEPGRRIVRIQKEGYLLYEQAQVIEPGRTTQLRVMMKPRPVEQPLADVTPAQRSEPTTPIDAAASPSSDPSTSSAALVQNQTNQSSAARTTVMITAGALTAVSAALWIGFAVRSASLSSEASDLRQRLGPEQNACSNGNSDCDELRDLSDRRASANKVAILGAVGTGVFAAGFVAAWQLWPVTRRVGTMLQPDVGLGRVGLIARGSF